MEQEIPTLPLRLGLQEGNTRFPEQQEGAPRAWQGLAAASAWHDNFQSRECDAPPLGGERVTHNWSLSCTTVHFFGVDGVVNQKNESYDMLSLIHI